MNSGLSYSLMVIAYNQEDTIRSSVRAALAQDCAPIEILLSDDCSGDKTYDIIREEAASYAGPHTVVLNRNPQNLGLARHINRCYELCSGDVIISTAGDDDCFPNRAQRAMEVFERDKPLLLFSHARVETLDGQDAPKTYTNALFFKTTDPIAAATSMQLCLGASCVWHKDLYRKYGPIKYPECYEDLILGFRAALEGRVAFVDDELLTYRVGKGLTNSDNGPENAEEFRESRLGDLGRQIAVLHQRLEDCRTFGFAEADEIPRLIIRRIAELEMRTCVVDRGWRGALGANWRRPLSALSAAISESRRQKRVLAGNSR